VKELLFHLPEFAGLIPHNPPVSPSAAVCRLRSNRSFTKPSLLE
jgi:hypothetical protein